MSLSVAINNMEVSPRDIVESAQAEFEGPLTGYAAGLLSGDWDRARDVVQDTFIKLYKQDADLINKVISPDGVHLTAEGNLLAAKNIAPIIRTLLTKKQTQHNN